MDFLGVGALFFGLFLAFLYDWFSEVNEMFELLCGEFQFFVEWDVEEGSVDAE